jgi:hypothetical protein
MVGIQEEAGRPRPLMKIIRVLDGEREVGGKKVYEMGAVGLLGMVRYRGESLGSMVEFVVSQG